MFNILAGTEVARNRGSLEFSKDQRNMRWHDAPCFKAKTPRDLSFADEMSCDVILIGFGCSGAVAAIEASDAGASVIILEKTDRVAATPWNRSDLSDCLRT